MCSLQQGLAKRKCEIKMNGRGSHGHGKPGEVMELVKSFNVMEKSWNFVVCDEIYCYRNLHSPHNVT